MPSEVPPPPPPIEELIADVHYARLCRDCPKDTVLLCQNSFVGNLWRFKSSDGTGCNHPLSWNEPEKK